jgi:hypothetical protein
VWSGYFVKWFIIFSKSFPDWARYWNLSNPCLVMYPPPPKKIWSFSNIALSFDLKRFEKRV